MSRTTSLELEISGMTCASCANRVERKLNKLDGVSATVNYATEKAKVSYGDGVTPDDLIATVEKTGYTARLPEPPGPRPPHPSHARGEPRGGAGEAQRCSRSSRRSR